MGGDAGGSRGQSTVELALLLPVLLWVCAGIVDFGRAYRYDIVVINAARVGARAAADTRNSDSTVRSAVKADASPAITLADPDITIAPSGTRTAGSTVTVTVVYTFTPITPLVAALFSGGAVTMSRTAAIVAF